MALNQEIQDKLREEINGLASKPTYAELDKLPYLENFVKESLRVYSPGGCQSTFFAYHF
jgi:cytochrome P450